MRNVFCQSLVAASRHPAFVFLTGDLGYKALEPLRESLGDRFLADIGAEDDAAGAVGDAVQVFGMQMEAERDREERDPFGGEILAELEAGGAVDRVVRALTIAEEEQDLLSTFAILEGGEGVFDAALQIGVAGGVGNFQLFESLFELLLAILVPGAEELAFDETLRDLRNADLPEANLVVVADRFDEGVGELHGSLPAFAGLRRGDGDHHEVIATLDRRSRQFGLQGDGEDLFVLAGAVGEDTALGEAALQFEFVRRLFLGWRHHVGI